MKNNICHNNFLTIVFILFLIFHSCAKERDKSYDNLKTVTSDVGGKIDPSSALLQGNVSTDCAIHFLNSLPKYNDVDSSRAATLSYFQCMENGNNSNGGGSSNPENPTSDNNGTGSIVPSAGGLSYAELIGNYPKDYIFSRNDIYNLNTKYIKWNLFLEEHSDFDFARIISYIISNQLQDYYDLYVYGEGIKYPGAFGWNYLYSTQKSNILFPKSLFYGGFKLGNKSFPIYIPKEYFENIDNKVKLFNFLRNKNYVNNSSDELEYSEYIKDVPNNYFAQDISSIKIGIVRVGVEKYFAPIPREFFGQDRIIYNKYKNDCILFMKNSDNNPLMNTSHYESLYEDFYLNLSGSPLVEDYFRSILPSIDKLW
ncbi:MULTISPECIES: hypothetical protein [Chitinophagaceae]